MTISDAVFRPFETPDTPARAAGAADARCRSAAPPVALREDVPRRARHRRRAVDPVREPRLVNRLGVGVRRRRRRGAGGGGVSPPERGAARALRRRDRRGGPAALLPAGNGAGAVGADAAAGRHALAGLQGGGGSGHRLLRGHLRRSGRLAHRAGHQLRAAADDDGHRYGAALRHPVPRVGRAAGSTGLAAGDSRALLDTRQRAARPQGGAGLHRALLEGGGRQLPRRRCDDGHLRQHRDGEAVRRRGLGGGRGADGHPRDHRHPAPREPLPHRVEHAGDRVQRRAAAGRLRGRALGHVGGARQRWRLRRRGRHHPSALDLRVRVHRTGAADRRHHRHDRRRHADHDSAPRHRRSARGEDPARERGDASRSRTSASPT